MDWRQSFAVGHSGIAVWEPSANYSVQVFFALSGWLIGGILLRSEPSDLPRFYFNRAARIWIPYFVAIAFLVLASLMKDRITQKWFEIFFYDVTFVYNFFGPPQLANFYSEMPLQATGNHFWSICAEEQFYLFAPFLITVLAKVGRSIWFWCIVSVVIMVSSQWGNFGSISLGVLASVVSLRFGEWQTSRAAQFVLLALFSLLFAATYFEIFAYRIGAPLSSICIVLLLAQPGVYTRVGAFLGGMSYPMYLNHWIGVFVANALFAKFEYRDTFICKLSGVLLGLIISAFLYVIIDRNIRINRDKYFSSLRGGTVAVGGFTLVALGLGVGLFFYSPFG